MTVEVKRGWLGRQVIRRYKVRRKTKAVSIVVREVYLRDDIPCGSALCQSCVQNSPPLPANDSHYVLPDADALLQFLEIWELPQITSVIYLASVVKEVLVRSNQRNYRRLRSLFTDRRRQSLFFDDEHFIYTWSLQSDADYVGKAEQSGQRVKAVATWFYEHLHASVRVIALQSQYEESPVDDSFIINQLQNLSVSDSSTNRVSNLKVLNVDTYFKEFWHEDSLVSELYASLVQSLSENAAVRKAAEESQYAEISGRKSGTAISTYKEYLPVHLLETDVANGVLRAGVFHVNKREPLEGYVHPSNKGEASQQNILVPGRWLQNRALPGDHVAVRILDRRHWLEASGSSADHIRNLRQAEVMDDEETGGTHNDVHEMQKLISEESRPIGKIVGILQRFQRDYVACLAEDDENSLRQSNSSRREHLLCVPMDRRVPMVRIATRLADRLLGQRFVIRIDGWDKDSRTPSGHFVRLLGPIGDLNAETMALLVENGISTSPFNSVSIQELPEDSDENPWTIPEEEFARRRDLRLSHRTCSIDPPGSKDVDDALSIRQLPNNLLEIGVHIADVSYFVSQDSLVDLEARARGTTVYMVGKSWHMLPGILSENLCSLIGGRDRLAVSVVWTVDPDNDFEVLDVWFGRTVIQSRHQMFYAQAQAILDGQTLPPGWELAGGVDEVAAVASDLLVFATFAQLRRELRRAQGALELASSELRFETSANQEPTSVATKLELPMNWIVAEMMILANSYVAQKIYQTFPSKALLRRHDPPRLDSFTLILECCAARGFTLDTSSNKALAKSLDRMRDSNDPIVENAFRSLATRAMSEAEYCSTGEATDPSGFYHYGLALHFYTHFTSPIRRYADVLVHRMLMASCEGSHGLETISDEELSRRNLDSVLPGMELTEVIHHLNERHRASKQAQKECNELYLLMYLQKHAQAEHAVVISFHDKGMMVFVPKYDVRASVYLQDKKGNIILPAEDDSMLNDSEENLIPILETRVLSKHPGTIRITDTLTSNILHEYKLMDTVWVQLRADGSRAHAPKLRVRLLSPAHPAAKRSIQHEVTASQTQYVVKRDGVNVRSVKGKSVTKRVDKNKAVNDMVQIVAAEEVSRKSSAKLMEKSSMKRKVPSIHDITEDFKRLRGASSVYPEMIENNGTSNGYVTSDIDVDAKRIDAFKGRIMAHQEIRVRWMPLTVYMKLSELSLFPEQQILEHIQQLWWKKLSKAAKVRAIRLYSILQEESEKQSLRTTKEHHVRKRAKVLGLYLI
ncbi:unnamed protein product [Calypogeia fissa]